jgi:AraC family transcriptional regulator, regulatory protein of adaptative response / methylated-DNA-[protein]-cysteine methyltransferase
VLLQQNGCMSSRHSKLIEQACRQLESEGPMPDLTALAATAGLSRWHFQRVFSAAIGVSPKRYAIAQRQRRLESALGNATSVTDAIYAAGYPASSGAYRDLEQHGLRPAQMKRGGTGESIRHTHTMSSLGSLLVAASARGICMVEFGDEAATVEKLRARFPRAQLNPADRELQDLVKVVVTLIDAPGQRTELPLDIRGTAFQTRVWQALTRIPAGETLSYAALARSIGAPTSARAVARACASNHIAVLVPCHRVIAGNGDLTGYKWGLERKRRLLDKEQAAGRNQPGVVER